jgi:hypothetical protein
MLPLPRIAGQQCDDFLLHPFDACRDVEHRAGRQKEQDVICEGRKVGLGSQVLLEESASDLL